MKRNENYVMIFFLNTMQKGKKYKGTMCLKDENSDFLNKNNFDFNIIVANIFSLDD